MLNYRMLDACYFFICCSLVKYFLLLLLSVYSCALLRDILLQGRLYISRNWLCFYANLFGKDIKVAIPVVTVRLVKKHKTAGLVPNGLAITTDTNQKYVFVSLLSRDSVYDVLRRICTHLQVCEHAHTHTPGEVIQSPKIRAAETLSPQRNALRRNVVHHSGSHYVTEQHELHLHLFHLFLSTLFTHKYIPKAHIISCTIVVISTVLCSCSRFR
uniref:GRAM domain containing 2A n=1 Tax=Xiphophorus couchianus TaxID=32473 RepID=A0A3B5MLD2_9TELE